MKINKKLAQAISGTVSTSILVSSCNIPYAVDYLVNDKEEIYEKISQKNSNANAIPIDIHLSKENVNYLNFLSILGGEILSDPSVAQSFSANPQKYISDKGFEDITVDLDESFLKIIIALGDEEIIRAIKDGDFKQFIRSTLTDLKNTDIQLIISEKMINLASEPGNGH